MKPKKLLQPKNSPITQGYSKQQMCSLRSRHSAFIAKWYFWLVFYPFSTLIPDPKRNTVSSTKFSQKNWIFSFNHQSSISRGRLTAGTLQKITHFIQENHLPNLQEAGETLTEALNTLGMAVCTGSLAASAGKAGFHGGSLGWDPRDAWYRYPKQPFVFKMVVSIGWFQSFTWEMLFFCLPTMRLKLGVY